MKLFICRHGETPWSLSGQHTGRTDVPLTENGIKQAERLGERLKDHQFAAVFTSPLQRAKLTCAISGYPNAELDDDLMEWDYGAYEGKKTKEIHEGRPDWHLFNDGVPDGEGLEEIGQRADRMLAKIKAVNGDVAVFSSGHFSRVLAARWLGLDTSFGKHLLLSTGSLSILGYERETPVILLWNSAY